jgi:hypothetical protein
MENERVAERRKKDALRKKKNTIRGLLRNENETPNIEGSGNLNDSLIGPKGRTTTCIYIRAGLHQWLPLIDVDKAVAVGGPRLFRESKQRIRCAT